MKLTAHVIEPKPSPGDPLGQRGYLALIWGANNEIFPFDSSVTIEEAAMEAALCRGLEMVNIISPSTAKGSNVERMRRLAAYAQRLVDRADLEASEEEARRGP